MAQVRVSAPFLNPYRCDKCKVRVSLKGLIATGLILGGKCLCLDCVLEEDAKRKKRAEAR